MAATAELDYMGSTLTGRSDRPQPMSGFFLILVPLALLAVVIVLGLGLLNMARGGSPQRSQEVMRWRVILQLVALIVVMTALYFAAK
jgi:hypothetical protein